MFLEDQKGKGLSSLYINWMRYIEYSISASVLLVAIALIAGISDADLLLCICIMCAACMLMGLVADWNYRVYIVAKELSESLYVKFFADICWWCAMISHVVAWIPIVIAWVIIMRRYYQWFDKENSRQPPQFVKTIIWGELFLFLLFGGVQILQMIFPKSRSLTELMYIFLSLFSKTLLGVAVAANIF